jgi:hypothetical protein
MTIVILTNYHGANLYDVAKVLYKTLPAFLCVHDKNIQVCDKGKTLCVARPAAAVLIQKGAYLGACDQPVTSIASADALKVDAAVKDQVSVFPNPAINRSTITFRTAQAGKVGLGIYDLNGMLIAPLYNGVAEKGIQRQVSFDAGKFIPGVYICRLQTSAGTITQKIIVRR